MIALLFVLTLLAWLGYEAWQLHWGAPTVSEQTWKAFKAYPPLGALIGLGVGLLFGHLFFGAACLFR